MPAKGGFLFGNPILCGEWAACVQSGLYGQCDGLTFIGHISGLKPVPQHRPPAWNVVGQGGKIGQWVIFGALAGDVAARA